MTPTGFHYQPHRIHSRRAISLRGAGRPAGHRPHRCNSRLTLTTATASDSDGSVSQVDFYQGATLIGTAAASPYSMIWSNVANGSYSLTAVATDNQGVVTTSAAVPIIVSAAIAIYNLYPDQLGTPRLVTNASNQVVWRNLPTTEPFGNTPPEDDPNATGNHFKFNLRFPGQYADKETNTNYNGFRDYDPSTGRYIQSDPIGLAGGINTYTYVGGNPLSRTDPKGLRTVLGVYLGLVCVAADAYAHIDDIQAIGEVVDQVNEINKQISEIENSCPANASAEERARRQQEIEGLRQQGAALAIRKVALSLKLAPQIAIGLGVCGLVTAVF